MANNNTALIIIAAGAAIIGAGILLRPKPDTERGEDRAPSEPGEADWQRQERLRQQEAEDKFLREKEEEQLRKNRATEARGELVRAVIETKETNPNLHGQAGVETDPPQYN